jgi:hypothetical protein
MPRGAPSKGRLKKKGKKKRLPRLAVLAGCAVLVLIAYFLYSEKKETLRELLPDVAPFQERTVYLYFGDTESQLLVGEERTIREEGSLSGQLEDVLLQLIEGPRSNLIRTIPASAVLQGVRIDEAGVALVSFSQELSSHHPGGSLSEIFTVYSIVDTLILNFSEVTRVQLLLDHEEFETLAGHIDCSKPLAANRKLIGETTTF